MVAGVQSNMDKTLMVNDHDCFCNIICKNDANFVRCHETHGDFTVAGYTM